MPVSIILSNQNIRLASARKNQIVRWETVSLPAGLIKDGYILDSRTLAGVIDNLFTSRKLPRGEVRVSLTGLSFTHRILILPRLKRGLQQEAIERATRKELKVSLDELYLDWQVYAETDKEVKVFVAGVPRPPIDALIKTMELARVNLTGIDIKVLALARAVNRAEAVIADFEPDWFDIAIISKGIPVTLHSVAPKNQINSLEDGLPQLNDELNRTIDFFNITHPESPVSADMSVILSGSLVNDPDTFRSIQEKMGRPLQIMEPPLKLPGDFPLPLFAANLGLILKNLDHTGSTKRVPDGYLDINIDPLKGRKRTLAHPVSRRTILAYAATIAAILLVLGGSQVRNQVVAETIRLQDESDSLNLSLKENRLALDQASAIETRISVMTGETHSLQKEYELISGRGELSDILETVSNSLPPGADYKAISSTAAEVIVDGRVSQRADIIDYVSTLSKSGKFSAVRIALIEKEPENQVESNDVGYIFKIVISR